MAAWQGRHLVSCSSKTNNSLPRRVHAAGCTRVPGPPLQFYRHEPHRSRWAPVTYQIGLLDFRFLHDAGGCSRSARWQASGAAGRFASSSLPPSVTLLAAFQADLRVLGGNAAAGARGASARTATASIRTVRGLVSMQSLLGFGATSRYLGTAAPICRGLRLVRSYNL